MSCPICVPVRAKTLRQMTERIIKAQQEADIVEVWLGDLPTEERDLSQLFVIKSRPYLLTVKGPEENGDFSGNDLEKLEILLQGARLGAEYCDFPHSFPEELLERFRNEKGTTELILSAHFFTATPSLHDLLNLAQKMQFLEADIMKIATFARSFGEMIISLELAERLREVGLRFIVIAMGEHGKLSRLATPLMGGEMMFACRDQNQSTAPGQLTVQKLRTGLEILESSK